MFGNLAQYLTNFQPVWVEGIFVIISHDGNEASIMKEKDRKKEDIPG